MEPWEVKRCQIVYKKILKKVNKSLNTKDFMNNVPRGYDNFIEDIRNTYDQVIVDNLHLLLDKIEKNPTKDIKKLTSYKEIEFCIQDIFENDSSDGKNCLELSISNNSFNFSIEEIKEKFNFYTVVVYDEVTYEKEKIEIEGFYQAVEVFIRTWIDKSKSNPRQPDLNLLYLKIPASFAEVVSEDLVPITNGLKIILEEGSFDFIGKFLSRYQVYDVAAEVTVAVLKTTSPYKDKFKRQWQALFNSFYLSHLSDNIDINSIL